MTSNDPYHFVLSPHLSYSEADLVFKIIYLLMHSSYEFGKSVVSKTHEIRIIKIFGELKSSLINITIRANFSIPIQNNTIDFCQFHQLKMIIKNTIIVGCIRSNWRIVIRCNITFSVDNFILRNSKIQISLK